ncbi:MAG TPA: N-methyl-L-tryptophan oxidase, partial [Gemmatimonadaceae bacterium]|nr:N-methyl-L-tryptophan oxidase [Gemmatimonadaceae bacterium]
MPTPHDVIVLGAGAMGSATAFHLARRGARVLLLEQFGIAHDQGSSHGYTRIIRLAYFEHPSYVPLLARAYDLWEALERDSGRALLHITGSLDAGARDSRTFTGSWHSCQVHGLPHEVLTAAEVTQRFPGYRLPDEVMAVFQPRGGFLVPEACIEAHVAQAQRHGATVRTHERVHGWDVRGDGVSVTTDR